LCKQQPDRHRWWPELGRRPGTAIAFVASSLVALAVAALAVGLLHSASSRPAGGPPAGTPFSQLTPGQQRVVHNDLQAVFIPSPHPCDTVRHRPSKTAGLGIPPTPLLATLGVLRRPPTAADTLPHKGPSPPRNIYRRYVRRARVAFGAAYYVIPTFTTTSLVDPARCVKVLARRFDHELQRVPAALTPAFRQQFEGLIANVRPREVVYLSALASHGSGWAFAVSATQIHQGSAISTNPVTPTISALVPDGVTRVTIHILARRANAGTPRVVTVNSRVVRNVVVASPPPGYKSFAAVRSWVWHGRDGQTIKTIPQPAGPNESDASGP
jgi:hypothetical protein